MQNLGPARYTSAFSDTLKQWQVYDRHTKNKFGRFDTKAQADRRATQLQVKHNTGKGVTALSHPVDAPPPRAYRDD